MNFKSWYARPLMVANRAIASRLRRSGILTRWIFGVAPISGQRPQYWDYTTLVLRKAIKNHARDGMRTLEIGVGENAILSGFLAKHFQVYATGVDLDRSALVIAQRSCKANNVSIELINGDMFSPCGETGYDLIFWNPPYVPSDAPNELLVGKQSDIQTDGGSDGLRLIRRFLCEAPSFLNQNGKVLLGYNSFYVDNEQIVSAVESSGLQITEFVRCWPNPSRVAVIQ